MPPQALKVTNESERGESARRAHVPHEPRDTARVTPTAQHPARPRVFVYGASGEGEARISEAAMSG